MSGQLHAPVALSSGTTTHENNAVALEIREIKRCYSENL
jgi:hypothetical protein